MMAVAPATSCKEVNQLEMDRRVILQGCRDGFAACYDTFVGAAASSASVAAAAGAAADGGASADVRSEGRGAGGKSEGEEDLVVAR